MDEWSAMLELRASGSSPYLYGDGLAIWITTSADHIEGPVFGREDQWNGIGVFFDTFQNLDHSHHHKHPYIYAMQNDGTKLYVPDAEKPDPSTQALPGAIDNSGCSFEFRYTENREDVDVFNHTRVHMTYQKKRLKLRLQQTSTGEQKEWFSCFDMDNVELPKGALYFGVSAATGDLVDNHDVIQFVVRDLAGIEDAEQDYEKWAAAEKQAIRDKLEEHDLRPAEALQRDYTRVLRAQASAIKQLSADVEMLKQSYEFKLASMEASVYSTKKNLDAKSDAFREMEKKVEQQNENSKQLEEQTLELRGMKEQVEIAAAQNGGWRMPFFVLVALFILLAGVGYNRYRKITKSHFL